MRLRIIKHLRLPYPSSTACPARGTACNALRYAYMRYIYIHVICAPHTSRNSRGRNIARVHYAGDSFRTLMHFDIRFPEVGQGSSKKMHFHESSRARRSKRPPPHIRIANVCPSMRLQVDARRFEGTGEGNGGGEGGGGGGGMIYIPRAREDLTSGVSSAG